jgi:hypothetical protein
MSGSKDKKKSYALGWKIGTCITGAQPKFALYGKTGKREGEKINERDRE